MRLPRDLSGQDLARLLGRLGYQVTRQAGSHVRLTCMSPSEHHVTIPAHDNLRVVTVAAIIASVASHHRLTRVDVMTRLFR